MFVYTLVCLFLVATKINFPASEAVEIDLVDDFEISGSMNSIMETKGLPYEGRAFLFGDKKDNLWKKGGLVLEITKQAKLYSGFAVFANIKIDPNKEGTLMWLETHYTRPIFGIWIECRQDCRLTMLYMVQMRSYEVSFDNIGPLHDQEWHKLVVHVSGMRRHAQPVATVYVDCAKQGQKPLLRGYVHFLTHSRWYAKSARFWFAQRSRGLRGGFEKPWRGSLQNVKFVFNRDIKMLTNATRCLKAMPVKEYHPPKRNGRIIEKMRTDCEITSFAKTMSGSMHEVEVLLHSQFEVTKYVRRLIENFHYAEQRKVMSCALKPCYPTVTCRDTPKESPGYKCGRCPVGKEGDGVNCTDIDECALSPCFPSVQCENTAIGYKCGPCPEGYRGGVVVGVGREHAREKQVCRDIDECAETTKACAKNAKCVNTVGSYKCGACKAGYHGNPYDKCEPVSQCSDPEYNRCHRNAHCFKKHRSSACVCKVGYVGNGLSCGLDSDMDGIPNYALSCPGSSCAKDNCQRYPNPDQSDIDKDGKGDACDDDMDGDGIPNIQDNCPKVVNKDQKNSDSDSLGDACDNCPTIANEDQRNTNGLGKGDACNVDSDNDGVFNQRDNCKFVANKDQKDMDRDGVGDACDNCPRHRNPKQEDADQDSVGDVCDNDRDRDRDGIQDSSDNCPRIPNASQLDTDSDRRGDACDSDDDNDRIADFYDNCPLIRNKLRWYSSSRHRGQQCKHDFDGDGVNDKYDACPKDVRMSVVDFRKYIVLDPAVGKKEYEAGWKVNNEGREVREETMLVDPSMLIGNHAFESVEFNGTLYVDNDSGDNMIGLIFGFKSAKSFHIITWKRRQQKYWSDKPFPANAAAGLVIKEVRSSTGPSEALRNALWNSERVYRQTRVLWKDPKQTAWNYRTPYKWMLRLDAWRMDVTLSVFQGVKEIIRSPKLRAGGYRGGRLGMFTFSQQKVIWTALAVKCL